MHRNKAVNLLFCKHTVRLQGIVKKVALVAAFQRVVLVQSGRAPVDVRYLKAANY